MPSQFGGWDRFMARSPSMFGNFPVYPTTQNEDNNLPDLYRMLTSTGPATERLYKYAEQFPKPEDYQGGVMNKIAAAMAGASAGLRDAGRGVAVATGIREYPYQKAVQDYMAGGKPIEVAAQREQVERKGYLDYLRAISDMKDEEFDRYIKAVGVNQAERRIGLEGRRVALDEQQLDSLNAFRDAQKTRWGTQDTETARYHDILAGQGERNLALRDRATTSLEGYRDWMINRPQFIRPSDQAAAKGMAIQQALREKPEWLQFYDAETGTIKTSMGWRGIPLTIANKDYKEFNDRVTALTAEYLDKARPGASISFDLGNLDTNLGNIWR